MEDLNSAEPKGRPDPNSRPEKRATATVAETVPDSLFRTGFSQFRKEKVLEKFAILFIHVSHRLDVLMKRADMPARVNFLSLDVEGAEV